MKKQLNTIFEESKRSTPERRKSGSGLYHVYMVQLEDRVWDDSRKFRDRNPHIGPHERPLACYYVGASSDPVSRVATHLAGVASTRSNRYVHRYFRSVLYSVCSAPTWNEIALAETSVAEALRSQGCAVWYA